MRLPEFLCVGAAKAGSTTLHEQLSCHPDLWLPDAKELHFFDNDDRYEAGPDRYASQFENAPRDCMLGEVTPAYMSYQSAAARIHETLGAETKLIFSLREPAARAFSEYSHNHRRGFLTCDFEDAIKMEFEMSSATEWERRRVSFISRGLYYSQISRFLELFPRENMMFLIMEEDLGDRLAETLSQIYEFLGVDPLVPTELRNFNRSYKPRSMFMQRVVYGEFPGRNILRSLVPSRKLRTRVRRKLARANSRSDEPEGMSATRRKQLQEEYYRADIEKLEVFLDRDLACWRVDGEAR